MYICTHTHTHTHILATWCKQLTHWKRPWCWVSLKAEGEEGNRGWRWNGWITSPIQWVWTWANSKKVKDRKAWCAAVQGVRESQAWLGDQTTTTMVNINTRGKEKAKEAAVPYVQLSNLMSTPISLLRPQFPTACSVSPLACQVCVLYVTGLRQSFYSLSTFAPLHSSLY